MGDGIHLFDSVNLGINLILMLVVRKWMAISIYFNILGPYTPIRINFDILWLLFNGLGLVSIARGQWFGFPFMFSICSRALNVCAIGCNQD